MKRLVRRASLALLAHALSFALAPRLARAQAPSGGAPPAEAPSVVAAPPKAPSLAATPAEPPSVVAAPAAVAPRGRYVPYRSQLIVSDLAALSLGVAGLLFESTELALVGAGVFVLGAPAVHTSNVEAGKGGISLAMRAVPAAVVAGGVAMVNACPDASDDSESIDDLCPLFRGSYAFLMSTATIVTASILDINVVARDRSRPPIAFAPAVVPTRQGVVVGLGGTF